MLPSSRAKEKDRSGLVLFLLTGTGLAAGTLYLATWFIWALPS